MNLAALRVASEKLMFLAARVHRCAESLLEKRAT
jgi:hypothetical protein